MKVSIILVNYYTYELINNAINSIMEKTKSVSFEIIIVDNSNDSEEYARLLEIEKKTKNIRAIDVHGNLGFGRANNIGASYATGDYLFFLNPDTRFLNDVLFFLVDYMDKHEKVGIVGPNLYTEDGKPNYSFCRYEKNIENYVKYNNILQTLLRKVTNRKDGFNYSEFPLRIYGYIHGAALMIRQTVFSQMGGFDKDIFMYAEEALLCLLVVRKTSYQIFNIPSAKVVHLEGQSFRTVSSKRAVEQAKGDCAYFIKMYGKKKAIEYASICQSKYRARYLLSLIFSHKKSETYKSYRDAYKAVKQKLVNTEDCNY